MRNKYSIPVLCIIVLAGCRDKYEQELKNTDKSVLVVEGVLNAGQGATEFTLSRSVPLRDTTTIRPVLNASLTVESINGDVYPLLETGNGNYRHQQLPLNFGEEYRLRIQAMGKEYLSDYVVARQSPDIDSVTWIKDHDGLKISVSTHDASNNTRYYKWDFDETWEIRSYFAAEFQWVGGTTIIAVPIYNYQCWKYDSSSTINIGSTAQLQEDVVNKRPIHFIPIGSEKPGVRYSMLVKQQSLTKAAYEYFDLLKKNTESLGTIFDPQPSQLSGNIRCVTDPAEYVIGYLTASSISEKRLFITSIDASWPYFQDCHNITIFNHPDSLSKWLPFYLPWGAIYTPGGSIEYYHMAPEVCVDCTVRGGNLNMPSYW